MTSLEEFWTMEQGKNLPLTNEQWQELQRANRAKEKQLEEEERRRKAYEFDPSKVPDERGYGGRGRRSRRTGRKSRRGRRRGRKSRRGGRK